MFHNTYNVFACTEAVCEFFAFQYSVSQYVVICKTRQSIVHGDQDIDGTAISVHFAMTLHSPISHLPIKLIGFLQTVDTRLRNVCCGKYLQSCGIDADGISGGSYSVPQTFSYPVRRREKLAWEMSKINYASPMRDSHFHNFSDQKKIIFPLGVIQVLRNAVGGGRMSDFPEKALR